MDQIIKLLKSYQTTGSIKGVARQYRVSKNTVRDYLRLARSHDEDLNVVLRLPQDELRSLLYPNKALSSSDRRAVFDARVDDWIKELKRVGVTRQLFYEEYKRSHPDGYGSAQF